MSTWVHRTMICPANRVAEIRQLAAALTPSAEGMWTTGLSATGAFPATHWISTGQITEEFAIIMSDPAILAQATGLTPARARNMLNACHVSDRDPWDVMGELGLQLCASPS